MEQKERLQHLSADELWSLREEIDLKLTAVLLARKSILEERLAQLRPMQIQLPRQMAVRLRHKRPSWSALVLLFLAADILLAAIAWMAPSISS